MLPRKMAFTALVLSAARCARPRATAHAALLIPTVPPNTDIGHHCQRRRRTGRMNNDRVAILSTLRRYRSSLGSMNVHENDGNDNYDTATTTSTTAAATIGKPSSSSNTATRNNSKRKSLKSGREKRRKFIGLAKAVDRGQWQNTYNPGGRDGRSFVAKSGLPDMDKSFCVLGIESSCDDTGGEYLVVSRLDHLFSFVPTRIISFNFLQHKHIL